MRQNYLPHFKVDKKINVTAIIPDMAVNTTFFCLFEYTLVKAEHDRRYQILSGSVLETDQFSRDGSYI